MSHLTEFLFPAPARRSTGAILIWWEKRRLVYNLFVGAAGLCSLGWMLTLSILPGGHGFMRGFPWIGVAAFAVMANVCYLLGPVAEILIHKLWGRSILPTGPALYRMGLTFSVGLALFPALLLTIAWVIRLVAGVG